MLLLDSRNGDPVAPLEVTPCALRHVYDARQPAPQRKMYRIDAVLHRCKRTTGLELGQRLVHGHRPRMTALADTATFGKSDVAPASWCWSRGRPHGALGVVGNGRWPGWPGSTAACVAAEVTYVVRPPLLCVAEARWYAGPAGLAAPAAAADWSRAGAGPPIRWSGRQPVLRCQRQDVGGVVSVDECAVRWRRPPGGVVVLLAVAHIGSLFRLLKSGGAPSGTLAAAQR